MSQVLNIRKWIDQNRSSFTPPVCNKLLHGDGFLKVMFVGGPNQRHDYHINQGEELFFMLEGDMNLRQREGDLSRDNIIKEGEIYLLPPTLPHSPQRKENTIGLVIERMRYADEVDGLRYFVDDTTAASAVLWQRWFYCEDLGRQLKPLIQEYFASAEYADRVPRDVPPDRYPLATTSGSPPFSLRSFLAEKSNTETHVTPVYDEGGFVVTIHGKGSAGGTARITVSETWCWCLEGSFVIRYTEEHGPEKAVVLGKDDSVLLMSGLTGGSLGQEEGSLMMVVSHHQRH